MLFSQPAIYRTDPTAALNSSFLQPTNLTPTSLTDSTVHIQTLHLHYYIGQNYKTVFLKTVKAKPRLPDRWSEKMLLWKRVEICLLFHMPAVQSWAMQFNLVICGVSPASFLHALRKRFPHSLPLPRCEFCFSITLHSKCPCTALPVIHPPVFFSITGHKVRK